MFAARNLRVMSWVGHNIFGNLDGHVLDDPANKQAKLDSKDRLLGEILGYQPQTLVSIEFIESLGDWKTAWDHIHFAGFLGTPMTLQFIWQGCDSVLAAPLVIDLVRFTELAWRRGQMGLLTFLASFFKSPLGVEEHRFPLQFQMLQQWLEEAHDPAPPQHNDTKQITHDYTFPRQPTGRGKEPFRSDRKHDIEKTSTASPQVVEPRPTSGRSTAVRRVGRRSRFGR